MLQKGAAEANIFVGIETWILDTETYSRIALDSVWKNSVKADDDLAICIAFAQWAQREGQR